MEDKKSDVLRFRVEFITSEEDCDEITGIINDDKKVVELFEVDGEEMQYRGFIPFSSIKKLEIIDESEEDSEEEI